MTRPVRREVPFFGDRAQHHTWYELRLDADRLLPPATGELECHRAIARDVAGLAEFGVRGRRARALLRRGHELWIAREGDDAVFACWLWLRKAPVAAARSGWIALPEHTACLGESVTRADRRGRGIAARAWQAIAVEIAALGYERLLIRVSAPDRALRYAVLKAGFEELAHMWVRRRAFRTRVDAEVLPHSDAGRLLAAHLVR